MPSDEYCSERLPTYTEYVRGRMHALWGRGWGRANVTYVIYVLLAAPECLEWALRDKRVRRGLTPSRLAYCRRVASRLAAALRGAGAPPLPEPPSRRPRKATFK